MSEPSLSLPYLSSAVSSTRITGRDACPGHRGISVAKCSPLRSKLSGGYTGSQSGTSAACDGCSTEIHHHLGHSAYLCAHSSGWNASHQRNRFSSLYDPNMEDATVKSKKKQKKDDRCARSAVLRRKARKIVKLLAMDQSLKAINKLPSDFVCGSLRTKIRSIYGSELTPVQELSVKTATKAEVQPCKFCEGLQTCEKLTVWRNARLSPSEYSSERLSEFGRAFAENVPKGWNNRKVPYIPNGNAIKGVGRKDGGNWVDTPFDDQVDVKLIYSSGKPRVVTLYSSHNVATLTPLHRSLYSHLEGRDWLLVGSPTDERLRYLQHGCKGTEWLSFDYESATDKIKTVYVQRAVEILIDKGDGLSDDEIRCLRVVASLSLDHVAAETGQPMGSPMSFPLLCLINKTVVDLALSDLLIKGEISFKEWTSHRCLINGDDLLTKSTSSGCLVAAVERRGLEVGLVTNRQKTMRDPEYGEINSTVFKNCVLQKKTNVSALWMAAEVSDVLGLADESCVRKESVLAVVLANETRLARQKIKTEKPLPVALRKLMMSNRRVRRALASAPPAGVLKETNLFPVVSMPDGYCLTREEEFEVLRDQVSLIKERKRWVPLFKEKRLLANLRKRSKPILSKVSRKTLWETLAPNKNPLEKRTLSCFAKRFELKRKEELCAADYHEPTTTIVSDLSRVEACLDAIRAWRITRKVEIGQRTSVPSRGDDPIGNNSDFVSLSYG